MPTTLREILCRKCEQERLTYYGTLLAIETEARKLLTYTQAKFPYYTLHDFSHSLQVEGILGYLIPDEVKETLNPEEIYFLLLSAWLHDWGMIGEYDEDPESIRDVHHLRTERFILDRFHELPGLNQAQAAFIGRICKGHRGVDLMDRNEYPVRRPYLNRWISERFLAACLKLADECDITFSRTPEIILSSINPKGLDYEEFRKHRSTYGVAFQHGIIEIACTSFSPEEEDMLRAVADKVQATLDEVSEILESKGVYLYKVNLRIERRKYLKPCRFRVDADAILDLLMGERLYSRSDVCIREILQNSIDSCNLRRQLEGSGYRPQITCEHPADNCVTVRDNGWGMDAAAIESFLLEIGRSYYSSPQFRDMVKSGDSKFQPISLFGIGIMSCFMVADRVELVTRSPNSEALRIELHRTGKTFKLEEVRSDIAIGTRVKLFLRKGLTFNLPESLVFYARHVRIPITVFDAKGEATPVKQWTMSDYLRQITEHTDANLSIYTRDVETDAVSGTLFFVERDIPKALKEKWLWSLGDIFSSDRGLWVSCQGIYVTNLADLVPLTIGYTYGFLNILPGVLDINIAREGFVQNDKYRQLADEVRSQVHNLYDDFFKSLRNDGHGVTEAERDKVNNAMYTFLPKRIPIDSLHCGPEMYVRSKQLPKEDLDVLYKGLCDLFVGNFCFESLGSARTGYFVTLNSVLAKNGKSNLVIPKEEYVHTNLQELLAEYYQQTSRIVLSAGGKWDRFARSYLKYYCKENDITLTEVGPTAQRKPWVVVSDSPLAPFLPPCTCLVRPPRGVHASLVEARDYQSTQEFGEFDMEAEDCGLRSGSKLHFALNAEDEFLSQLARVAPQITEPDQRDLINMYLKLLIWAHCALFIYLYERTYASADVEARQVRNVVLITQTIEEILATQLGLAGASDRINGRLGLSAFIRQEE